MNGQVTHVNTEKRYGFIRGDDGQKYFFLSIGLQKTGPPFASLATGDRVSFTRIQGPKGLRAIEIGLEP